jgi:hypothetical protein
MTPQEPPSNREEQIYLYIVGLMKSGASDQTVKESLRQLGIEPSSVLHLIREAMVQAQQSPIKPVIKTGDKLKAVQDKKKSVRNLLLIGLTLIACGWILLQVASLISTRDRVVLLLPAAGLFLSGIALVFVGLYNFATAYQVD